MVDSRLHTCFYKLRCSCKNNVAVLSDGFVNCFFCKILCKIFIAFCCDFFRESLFQMQSSKFMRVGPRRSSRCLCIQKCNLQLRRTCRKQPIQQRFLFDSGRIHLEINFLIVFQKFEFFPGFCNQFFHFIGSFLINHFIIINCQECKKCISGRDRQFLSAKCFIFY